MTGISAHLYQQSIKTLLKCREFETDTNLRAIFRTSELSSFQTGIKDTDNRESRVDLFLDYILDQNHITKGPVFPIFLNILRQRYPIENALRASLDELYRNVLIELELPIPAEPHRQPNHSQLQEGISKKSSLQDASGQLEEQTDIVANTSHEGLTCPNFQGNLDEFDRRLAEAFPGKSGFIFPESAPQIDRLLQVLSRDPVTYRLSWTRGISSTATHGPGVDQIKKIADDIWLVGCKELKIEALCIYRDPYRLNKQFVLLQTAPMPPLGIYEGNPPETEYVYLYQGQYISSDEARDGFASINGDIVKLSGEIENRSRDTIRQFTFLSVKGSDIEWDRGNQKVVAKVYTTLMEKGTVERTDLEPLLYLEKRELEFNQ